MTTEKPSEDGDLLGDVFGSDRDRSGRDPAPKETPAEDKGAGPERDERGRFAGKKPDAEPPPAGKEPAPSETPDPNASRHVPLTELLKERESKREFKTQLEALRQESEKRDAEYRRQLAELQRGVQAVQKPPAPPPDPSEDPAGAFRHYQAQVEQASLSRLLDFSEAAARRHYGKETVDAAFAAAEAAGLVADGRFLKEADPYEALIAWHKRETALQRIGPDPDAFEKTLREKLRAELLEELGKGAPAAPPKFPGTLADATAARGNQGAVLTDDAMMSDVFGSGRKRK